MKLLLAVVSLAVCALAAEVQIISHEATLEHNGKYHYHYELGDGSKATQDGKLKHITEERDGESIEGRFAFIGDDGQEYAVAYTADENGYRPVGAHLPTPPPTPESVLKTLKYLEQHPYKPPKGKKN